jgi:hypothetical protein
MTEDQGVQLGALIVLVLAAVIVAALSVRHSRRQKVIEDDRVTVLIAEQARLHADNSATPGVCVVCGQKATKPWVVFGTSDFSFLNVLDRLYAQIPKYKVMDHGSETKWLCAAHYRMAWEWMEQKIANARARAADFNSQIALELASYEGGGLHAWLKYEWRKAESHLEAIIAASRQQVIVAPPALPAASSSSMVTLSPKREDEG